MRRLYAGLALTAFLIILLVLPILSWLSGEPTAPPAAPQPITVLAASSLTDALGQVGAAWTAAGHPPVTFSFDSSARLARQIEAGAPADAFFSADTAWMSSLDEAGRIVRETRVDLLGNRLVLVVPAGAALRPASASDLADPGIRRLALAGESVPAGRYGRDALTHLGALAPVADRVVNGDNVRAVLGWVASGEADAGIVYATDAAVEPRVEIAFGFPPDSHAPITYPAAVLTGAAHAADAADFLTYCQGPQAMATFRQAGFTPPPGAP